MLRKEEYLKTVKRPYPPIFCSLVCIGYPNKEHYKGIVGEPFSIMNMAHVDNVWYYGKADMEKGGKLALVYWSKPRVLEHIKKEFKKREDNLIKSAKESFELFSVAYGEFMPALALIFAIDKPLETKLRSALSEKLPSEKVEELIGKLNIPLEDNFYKQEEYDLVNTNNLSEHVKKYNWLNARYGEDRTYTIEEAQEKLDEISKKEFLDKWKKDKNELKKIISYAKDLLDEEAYLVDIFQYIIYYRTQRTDIMNKAAFLAIPMLEATAKSNGLTYEQFMRCSALEILENKIPTKEVLDERMGGCSTILDNGKVNCLTGRESEDLINFFEEDVNDVEELKGSVACGGNIKGMVKIINNKEDFDKIKMGDILVTSMTTPEMIPIMKKAVAFITDEGGITCHAAIIAREMDKPCIIGTKIATRVLKDGVEVEVDADKGIVKIIKNNLK